MNVSLSSFIGCRDFYCFHHFGGAALVYTDLPGGVSRHPLRELE